MIQRSRVHTYSFFLYTRISLFFALFHLFLSFFFFCLRSVIDNAFILSANGSLPAGSEYQVAKSHNRISRYVHTQSDGSRDICMYTCVESAGVENMCALRDFFFYYYYYYYILYTFKTRYLQASCSQVLNASFVCGLCIYNIILCVRTVRVCVICVYDAHRSSCARLTQNPVDGMVFQLVPSAAAQQPTDGTDRRSRVLVANAVLLG